MTFYGIRHEDAAAFAVSAYGKLTDRLAACLSIAGPGAFQEVDLVAVFGKVAQWSQPVLQSSKHAG